MTDVTVTQAFWCLTRSPFGALASESDSTALESNHRALWTLWSQSGHLVLPGPLFVLFIILSSAQLLLNVLICPWIATLLFTQEFSCSIFLSIISCPRHLWLWSLSAAITAVHTVSSSFFYFGPTCATFGCRSSKLGDTDTIPSGSSQNIQSVL